MFDQTSAIGSIALEIANNGEHFTTNGNLFLYYLQPIITELIPANGPWIGGTAVSVYGLNFTNTTTAVCMFGNKQTIAEYINNTLYTCNSPASNNHSDHSVYFAISQNIHDFTPLMANLTYLYYDLIEVIRTEPTYLPQGVSETITIFGFNFKNFSTIECKIGNTEIVSAYFVSTNVITCITSGSHSGTTFIEVSNNQKDFSNDRIAFDWITPM